MNIVFVCTGNTCRSPMAEALGNRKGEHRCSSAGIFAHSGSLASPLATEVCLEHNISLGEHRSRQLSLELMKEAQLILTMTNEHKTWIESHYGEQESLYTLGEYADVEGIGDVSDPYGGTISDYRNTLSQLKTLLDAVWRRMQ
jgi:protein-tyrosine phosphatase